MEIEEKLGGVSSADEVRKWSGSWKARCRKLLPPRRKVAKSESKIKILTNDSHLYTPTFAALASLRPRSGHALREILRDSVAAPPRWGLGGERNRTL